MSGRFDVVVVGGGLAGLSCAAMLSKTGSRVLLLEKNRRCGGYAVSSTVKEHRFDIAIQAIGGCDQKGIIYRLLQDINRGNSIRFLACEPVRAYYFKSAEHVWLQPANQAEMIDSLCHHFPDYCSAIKNCYQVWTEILTELERIASFNRGMSAFGFSENYPTLARYSGYTVKMFLDELRVPDKLQALLTARSGYCMLPTNRLSLVGFACTEMTYGSGAWLIEGGMEQLTKTLVTAIIEQGGIVEHSSPVNTIVTSGGGVHGVVTRDGRFYQSQRVVIASAVQVALEKLLDKPALLPNRYYHKITQMNATGSYYIAYYSVCAEAVQGLWPNIEIRTDCSTPRISEKWSSDVYYILIPSLVDTTAAPPGCHCLCLSVPCLPGYTLGTEGRRDCRKFLEQAVEERFPTLKRKMTLLFEFAPEHLASISGNPGGSAYGWAQTPEQSGIKRLNIKTPIPGLYLAGHWTMPGGGIAGVVTSGRLCAQAIIEDRL